METINFFDMIRFEKTVPTEAVALDLSISSASV
jgi:hypothetical protein